MNCKNITLLSFFVLIASFTSLYPYADFELKEDCQIIKTGLSCAIAQCRRESLTPFAVVENDKLERVLDAYKYARNHRCSSFTEGEQKQMLLQSIPPITADDEEINMYYSDPEDHFETQSDRSKAAFQMYLIKTIKQMNSDLQSSNEEPISVITETPLADIHS